MITLSTLEIILIAFVAALIVAVFVDFYYVWHYIGKIVKDYDELAPLVREILPQLNRWLKGERP